MDHAQNSADTPDTQSQLSKPLLITSWILQIALAFILGQTLFFKLTGAPETIALFEVVGAEPMGRFATAIAELVCVVLLLIPKTSVLGAIGSVGVISGAIMAHITKLGISIDPVALAKPEIAPLEGPSLFVMAVIVFVGGLVIIAIRRAQIPIIGPKLAK
ncbi:MAG: DoxX family protein [Phycisphaerales bacterium]|nr:DoxX family protein [Phycisphaerales bacterium]